MKVLLTNDDGPVDDEFSPYIRHFLNYVKRYTDWEVTICVPNQQRSWVSKAHFPGANPRAVFIYTAPDAEDNQFLGPFSVPQQRNTRFTAVKEALGVEGMQVSATAVPDDYIEWCLLENGTPATCADIGLNHLIKDYECDLVISGPNVGRNTSSAYVTSSGTVGAAMNAVITNQTKAIALSWAYFEGPHFVSNEVFQRVCLRSIEVVEHLYYNWDPRVEIYSVNVPLKESVTDAKVLHTSIYRAKWCSLYAGIKKIKSEAEGHQDIMDGHGNVSVEFQWEPNFSKVRDGVMKACGDAIDGKVIEHGNISVTPLLASFDVVYALVGSELDTKPVGNCVVLSIPETQYIYTPLCSSLRKHLPGVQILSHMPVKIDKNVKVFHYAEYEDLLFDELEKQGNYYANSYVYRKSLIRKHYLSHTIHSYVVKHPKSILQDAYPESFTINVDYAEFLEDSLDENWDLRQELEKEEHWWILKPSMSDKGQGIRIFKTIEQLQDIFNSFDEDGTDDEGEDDNNRIVTSQLRDFVIQRYITNPLLLPSVNNRKFHIRCYVTCRGDLEVNVFSRMLALFAPTPFTLPTDAYDVSNVDQLASHLTNTCLQSESSADNLSVHEFDSLADLTTEQKEKIKEQIYQITKESFLAALCLNRLHFQPLANCFETFGIDFLVDADLQVKLLEINAFPDFKQTGVALKSLISELFDNIVSNCVKPIYGFEPTRNSHFIKVLEHSSNNW